MSSVFSKIFLWQMLEWHLHLSTSIRPLATIFGHYKHKELTHLRLIKWLLMMSSRLDCRTWKKRYNSLFASFKKTLNASYWMHLIKSHIKYGMNPPEIRGEAEKLEVVYFLGAKLFWDFRGGLSFMGVVFPRGDLVLSGTYVIT